MFFQDAVRYHYQRPQLREVICQVRFPAILSIGAKEPAEFQEAVRAAFPRYAARQDQPAPRVTMKDGEVKVEKPQSVTNYNFISADNRWKLNLTRDFISLSTVAYQGWEDFARRLDQPLAQFIRIYQPAFFQRIGLRYVNIFSRRDMGLVGTPWRELFTGPYLGLLNFEDVDEGRTVKSAVDYDTALDGSCRVKVHAGPGNIKSNVPGAPEDKEVKFILDMDLYMGGEVAPMLAAPSLETLHNHSTRLFQGAITRKLHDAMVPEN